MNRKDSEKKVKLSRIARIDEEIRSGKYPNSDELASKMEVTPRTILRDIEYLKNFYNAPIEYDHTKHGFYYTKPNFFIKSVMLTDDEFKKVAYYYDVFKKSDSYLYDAEFSDAIGKILAVMPDDKIQKIPFLPADKNRIESVFEPSIKIEGEIFFELHSAINNKEVIQAEYWTSSNRKKTIITLEPLSVFYKRHIYYLLACENEQYDKPGVYSINRLQKLYKTGKHFEIPSGFKPSKYIKEEADANPRDDKLYLFELLFPKEVAAKAIETTFYPNQTAEQLNDGTVFVSFRSTQLYEVFYWVLGRGREVKVLNPPKLVTMIKEEIQNVAQYYFKEVLK